MDLRYCNFNHTTRFKSTETLANNIKEFSKVLHLSQFNSHIKFITNPDNFPVEIAAYPVDKIELDTKISVAKFMEILE